MVFVYLTLAAQYESYVLPFIVLLGVPVALLGALAAVKLRALTNDVYCQIGLVMLIGLASKNAILIVEFAEQLQEQGLSPLDAAVEAARIRLRPILMTSLAFILGVVPLVIAQGAGAAGRVSVGTTVFRRNDRRDKSESSIYPDAVRRGPLAGAAQETRRHPRTLGLDALVVNRLTVHRHLTRSAELAGF